MSTVNVTLYANGPFDPGNPLAPGRLVTSPTSAAPPQLPAMVSGDTWNIGLYYESGDTAPFTNTRYAGSSSKVRLRAAGNNTIYATATSGSEIAPTTGITVTQTQGATNFAVLKQEVVFNSTPTGGTFQLTFRLGISSTESSSNAPPIRADFAAVCTFAYNVTAAQMQDTLRNLQTYFAYNRSALELGRNLSLQYFIDNGMPEAAPIVNAISGGFEIVWGALTTAGGGAAKNPYIKGHSLVLADTTNLQYTYGWVVSLPLNGNGHTFTDLFLMANRPAYLEVLLTPSGQPEQVAAQFLLASVGDIPVFQNGPPDTPTLNQAYAFQYLATAQATFSLSDGFLPSGLSINSAGLISGTPTVAGTYTGIISATNSSGSATQTFALTVLGTPGGSTPATNIIFDGNYANLLAVGKCRQEQGPSPRWDSLVYRQDFQIFLANYVKPPLGSGGCPLNVNARFVSDGPMRDLGAGIIQFERTWANVPGNWTEPCTATKQFQTAELVVDGSNNVVDFNIVSWSQSIAAQCNHLYYFGGQVAPAVTVPAIQIVPFLSGSKRMTDNGTGFPHNPSYPNQYGTNQNTLTNISYSMDLYMGDIYEVRIIQGTK